MDWFLYDNELCHESVKVLKKMFIYYKAELIMQLY